MQVAPMQTSNDAAAMWYKESPVRDVSKQPPLSAEEWNILKKRAKAEGVCTSWARNKVCWRQQVQGLPCKFEHQWKRKLTPEEQKRQADAKAKNVCFDWAFKQCNRTHCKFNHWWPEDEEEVCQECPEDETNNYVQQQPAEQAYGMAQQAQPAQAQAYTYPATPTFHLQLPNTYSNPVPSPAQTPTLAPVVNYTLNYSAMPNSVPPSPALSAASQPYFVPMATPLMTRAPSPMPFVDNRAPSPMPYIASTPTSQPPFYQMASTTYGQATPTLPTLQLSNSYSNQSVGYLVVTPQQPQATQQFAGSECDEASDMSATPSETSELRDAIDAELTVKPPTLNDQKELTRQRNTQELEVEADFTDEEEEEEQETEKQVTITMSPKTAKMFAQFKQLQLSQQAAQ